MLIIVPVCIQTIYMFYAIYRWTQNRKKVEELEEKDRRRTELFKIYAEITQNEIQELDKNIKCFKENQDHKISRCCIDSLKGWESKRKRIEESFGYRPPIPMYQYMLTQGIENRSCLLYDPEDLLNCCKRY